MKFVVPIDDDRLVPSLPTRGAWIEMTGFLMLKILMKVAPHTGSVD